MQTIYNIHQRRTTQALDEMVAYVRTHGDAQQVAVALQLHMEISKELDQLVKLTNEVITNPTR